MSLHVLTHDRRSRPSLRRNGLLQLGQPHFWLLAGVLGFMIAIVVLVIFAQLLSR
jgi:hypothetical protein